MDTPVEVEPPQAAVEEHLVLIQIILVLQVVVDHQLLVHPFSVGEVLQ